MPEMDGDATNENVKTLFHRMERVEDKLFGNGQPGLVSEVSGMKSDLGTIKKQNFAIFTVILGVLVRLLFGG